MPITFSCSCGKRLQVKDEVAGRPVKCPACTSVVTVPTPPPAEPQFEVVEDEPAPTPSSSSEEKPKSSGRSKHDDDEEEAEERPRKKGRSALDDEDDEDEPRSRRRRRDDEEDDEDEEDERPRRRRSRRQPAGSTMGKRIGYMIGGLVLVLIGVGLAALGWYGGGRSATKMLILGVCLGIAGIGTGIKGLLGNVDDGEGE